MNEQKLSFSSVKFPEMSLDVYWSIKEKVSIFSKISTRHAKHISELNVKA